jgi:hypothetical protein
MKTSRGIIGGAGLGGAVLSLALLSGARAQDAAEAPGPAEAQPVEAQEAVPAEQAVPVPLVVVQGRDVIRDEEMLREIYKDLVESGVPAAEAREMLGLDAAPAEPGGVIDADAPVVNTASDGQALYLPLGTTMPFELEAGTTLELPFTADGPGLLTIAYGGDVTSLALVVVDGRERHLGWETTRDWSGRRASPVQHALVPVGRAGAYRVRLSRPGGGTVKLGAEWLPFAEMRGQEAAVVPMPNEHNEVALVPGRLITAQLRTDDPDAQYLWCRFDAEADGQLAVLANADRGDIIMETFEPGQYANALAYHDDDLNGTVANEGLVLDVVAGQSYYVRVSMRSGNRCGLEVRAGWVQGPDDEDEQE